MFPAAAIRPDTNPQNKPTGLLVPMRTFFENEAKTTEGINANVNNNCVIQPDNSRLGPLDRTPQIPQQVAAMIAYSSQGGIVFTVEVVIFQPSWQEDYLSDVGNLGRTFESPRFYSVSCS